jgi:di/tricarboxylate transporter
MLAAGLMIITRCCTASDARKSIDWQVLLVIAAALGLGKAMSRSGLADVIGHGLLAGFHDPTFALAAVFILTAVLAAVITAKAAAVLVLPIALATSATLGVSFMPFAVAVTIAAATSLATPIGYPTNLMVYGPGGYRFTDYLRLGLPLTILIAALCIGLIPLIWPFH